MIQTDEEEPSFNTIRVPQEFHVMVRCLERAHRNLARIEAGAPLEDGGGDPATYAEAYRNVCQHRKWLYEYAEENLMAEPYDVFSILRFT